VPAVQLDPSHRHCLFTFVRFKKSPGVTAPGVKNALAWG
jgi:hypothetical protein